MAKIYICTNCHRRAMAATCDICGGQAVEQKMEIEIYTPKGGIHGPACRCLQCPRCGATEVDDCRKSPGDWTWQIRPFVEGSLCHCLKCDNYWNEEG